jgi:peptide/nickel transport system substrate-binding protein
MSEPTTHAIRPAAGGTSMPDHLRNHSVVRLLGRGLTVIALVATSGCGSAMTPAGERESNPRATLRQVARGSITIALGREPDHLSPKFGGSAGLNEVRWIFNSPLTYYDLAGNAHPMIARQIPTRENGDWSISPDGTMVTTYRLRENARWHDGSLLTGHDFAFAHRVYTDAAVPTHDRYPERLMLRVDSPDDGTVVITWSEPYIYANVLGSSGLPPLPRQQLEEKYLANKASFPSGDEWTSAYVGSGPFRLEHWEPGIRMLARANADWFLGSPRIETLDIRFIVDPSALLASLLAGEVDYAASPAIRLSEAIVARDQWVARGEGYLRTWEKRLKFLEFQYREVPNWQRAMTDRRIRQALIHAVDRQALADVMTHGLSRAADAWALPSDPAFPEVDRVVAKYPFDAQRAMSLLSDAGWRPHPGGLLMNSADQTLDIEINTGSSEPQIATIITDNWRTIGINASVFVLPVARQRDRAFRASYPAVHTAERSITNDNFHLISSLLPTPPAFNEPNWGGFNDVEVDRLHTLAVTSLEEASRVRWASTGCRTAQPGTFSSGKSPTKAT